MIFTHKISPIAFEVGPLQVHWYGIFFAVGILLAYLVMLHFFKTKKYPVSDLESLIVYLFFGMLIGARLGHVFFYEAGYYLSNPLSILKVWEGGLASHGAAIGVLVAYLLWTFIHKVKFSKYPDILILGFPLLAGFVRLGNFFNSEILGKMTDGNWGVIFSRLGEDFPRHPVQLYSAFMNWAIFLILILLYRKFNKKVPALFFLFLYVFLYFSGRFIVEFWKDLHGPIASLPISMGQFLSVFPVLVAVGYFVFYLPKKIKSS
jgi:phosphatidylglycerol---prolipoprotein diacylglyceryl transferase